MYIIKALSFACALCCPKVPILAAFHLPSWKCHFTRCNARQTVELGTIVASVHWFSESKALFSLVVHSVLFMDHPSCHNAKFMLYSVPSGHTKGTRTCEKKRKKCYSLAWLMIALYVYSENKIKLLPTTVMVSPKRIHVLCIEIP